jgi:hypothetical protein
MDNTNIGMDSLTLDPGRLTPLRTSQTSLLSGNSDDASGQLNDVSHRNRKMMRCTPE